MTIKTVLKNQLDFGFSKYAIAKKLGVQPIMIDYYLTKPKVWPEWRVCKAVYDNFNMVISPYKEEELNTNVEQTLIVYPEILIENLVDVKNRLNTDNIYDKSLLDNVISYLSKL